MPAAVGKDRYAIKRKKSSYQSLVDKLVSLGAGLLVFVNDCGFGGHCNPAPKQSSKKNL
jgi:hypothetical protein